MRWRSWSVEEETSPGCALVLSSTGHHIVVADADFARADETCQAVQGSGGTAEPMIVDIADVEGVVALVSSAAEPES